MTDSEQKERVSERESTEGSLEDLTSDTGQAIILLLYQVPRAKSQTKKEMGKREVCKKTK